MYRKLSSQEEKLLELLINRVSSEYAAKIKDDWKTDLTVESMNDGGMGSLLLLPSNTDPKNRKFGGRISDYEFLDEDGVTVLASINIDQNGKLFELDIWKTDFNVLIRYCDPKDL